MKKIKFIIPILILVLASVLLLTDCQRDHSCKMKIVCMRYDGMDTLGTLPNAHIVVGRDFYGSQPSAEYAKRDTVADVNGVCVITFAYPALLDVNVSGYNYIYSEDGELVDSIYYTGTAQVQLNEGEMTDKTILTMETHL